MMVRQPIIILKPINSITDIVPFSCSSGSLPSGVSLKLSYRVESTKGFFFSFFQLPYDTPHCPVDAFININSVKEMNGFSFYSSCLELVYDKLVFAMLSHKFYLPMDSSTLCTDPRDFAKHFSSPSSYGLWVQSSLFPTTLSYYQLSPLLKLQPGQGRATMTIGFSKSTTHKVGLLHSVEITVLDVNFESPIFLQDRELSFSGSTVIFNNELYFAQLTGTAPTTTSWAQMRISIDGWFPRTKDRFLIKLEESVRRHLQQIANRANARLGTVADEVSAASDGVATAATAFSDALSHFALANQDYRNILNVRNRLKSDLARAEEALQSATGELKMAEEAVADLCDIKTCIQICVNTTRPRFFVEDVYKNETFQCTIFTSVTKYRREPLTSYWATKWSWKFGCYDHFLIPCGFYKLCKSRECRWVRTPENYWHTVYHRVQFTYIKRNDTSCTRRVFVGRIGKVKMFSDPCGRTVPDAACGRSNELCQNQRDSAFSLIDEKREGLTKPLRQRNTLKRQLSISENNLLKSSLARTRARDNAMRAEIKVAEAEEKRNATLHRQQAIRESDDTGYRVSELLKSSDITNVFSIANITFTAVQTSASTPYNFPINIEYTSGSINQVISRQYYFKTSYESQKDSLVAAITNDLIERRTGQQVSGRRKRAENEVIDGEREFQSRCIQLTSLINFLNTLHETLTTANKSRTMIFNDLQTTLRQAYAFNSSLHSNNVSVNYTRLQNTFNISSSDFERVSNQNDTELVSYLEVLDDIIDDARVELAALEPDSITLWRRETASSLEANFTLGNSICYGLKDCILVFSAEVENMLDFAPLSVTKDIEPLVSEATESLLMLSFNTTSTFSESFEYLKPMMNITDAMNKPGYWCAEPPTVEVTPPTQVNVSVGGVLVLSCRGDSFLPLSYQWRKDGIVIKNGNQSRFTLPNMQVFDEGNYSCDITNAVDTVNTTYATVLTYETPRFYLTPVSMVTYAGDENGTLFTCNATSRPGPGWKWFHKSSLSDEWKEIEGERTNELFIPKPKDQNVGWYICMAFNYHGNISSDPVYLRIVRVTTKVVSLPISFVLEKRNSDSNVVSKRQTENIRSSVMRYLKDKAGINSSYIKRLSVVTDDNGKSYQISFHLLSHNTTDNDTGEILANIAEKIRITQAELMDKRNKLKRSIDNNETVVTGTGSRYSPVQSSFTVQHTDVLCPQGQKLHSNSFLCSKLFYNCNVIFFYS